MYKVFLVDDEIVVREGIRDNVRWDGTDFVLSGEATDGEVALPLIQEIKPDILVTDIKMPFMDGLQLSRIIRKMMPWVKIIVLSGHDEFKFAQEAISLGVTEYLLKPVSSMDLIQALNRVAQIIENEKKSMEDMERLKKQLQRNEPVFREKFLTELSLGLVSPAEVINKCSEYDIQILSKYYLVEVICFELSEKLGKEYSEYLKAESILNEIADRNTEIIKFKRNMEEAVLIFKGDHVQELEESAYSFAQSIKYGIERNTGCVLTIGVGSVRDRIQGIAQSFHDAETAKNYKYVFGKNKIIGINDVKNGLSDNREFLKSEKTNISEYLKCGSKSNMDEVVEGYVRNLTETNVKSFIYVYYFIIDIVIAASKFIDELGGEIEKLVPEINGLEKILISVDTIDKFKDLAKKILTRVMDFRDSRIESKYDTTIGKAKEYILSNFTSPSISLNSVAAYVNVSPSHFSTIFSQETGETFIEHLTGIRIKKAMELLKTTVMKSSEIAYCVGYNDPHYFSYLFKKVTGITPKDFRNEGKETNI